MSRLRGLCALALMGWAAAGMTGCLGGDGNVGNGGDDVRARFIGMGQEILLYFRTSSTGWEIVDEHGLDIGRLRATLTTQVIKVVKEDLKDNGDSLVDATGERGRIRLLQGVWRSYFEEGTDVYYLVFHEMLRAAGYKDDDFAISGSIRPFVRADRLRLIFSASVTFLPPGGFPLRWREKVLFSANNSVPPNRLEYEDESTKGTLHIVWDGERLRQTALSGQAVHCAPVAIGNLCAPEVGEKLGYVPNVESSFEASIAVPYDLSGSGTLAPFTHLGTFGGAGAPNQERYDYRWDDGQVTIRQTADDRGEGVADAERRFAYEVLSLGDGRFSLLFRDLDAAGAPTVLKTEMTHLENGKLPIRADLPVPALLPLSIQALSMIAGKGIDKVRECMELGDAGRFGDSYASLDSRESCIGSGLSAQRVRDCKREALGLAQAGDSLAFKQQFERCEAGKVLESK